MDQTAVMVAGEAPASSTDSDQTELPADRLARTFGTLQISDIFCSGTVCRSPCLVYSAADRDDGTATLHHLSTDKLYHVTLPDPAFRSRYVMGSSHGWLITTDERSNLILVNPVNGAQIVMPPPETMPNVALRYGEDGKLDGYDLLYVDTVPHNFKDEQKPYGLSLEQGRFCFYKIVAISSDPSSGNCTVVRVHMPHQLLSYAKVGDTKWTWVDAHEDCKHYVDVCYDSSAGLFYALRGCGDVHTIDFHGPSPVVNIVYKHKGRYSTDSKYIAKAPWGDFFQIWRWDRYLEDDVVVEEDDDNDNGVDETVGGLDVVAAEIHAEEDKEEIESKVDVTNEDSETETETDDDDDEEEEEEEKEGEEEKLGVSEEEEDEYTMEEDEEEKERVTAIFHVYKIDLANQKLAKVNNLQDHTLFTGFNTSFMLPVKDFPTLIPNSIYHTDDLNHNTFSKRFSDRQVLIDQGLRQGFIFNMEDSSFTDIMPPSSSRLNWPPPVWIQPSLYRV